MRWARGAIAAAVGAAAAGVALAASGGTPAEATTGSLSNLGLPEPTVHLSADIGDAYIGRFYIAKAPRAAHIVAGRLDFTYVEEANEFFSGELTLRSAKSQGQELSLLALYPFEYVEAKGVVHSSVIPPTSVSPEHPLGVAVGAFTLDVPKSVNNHTGTGNNVKQVNQVSALLQLHGKTYRLMLRRENANSNPVTTPLHRAKLT